MAVVQRGLAERFVDGLRHPVRRLQPSVTVAVINRAALVITLDRRLLTCRTDTRSGAPERPHRQVHVRDVWL
jgi:hypothetical protein